MNVKNRTDVKAVGGAASPSSEQTENGVVNDELWTRKIGAQTIVTETIEVYLFLI